MNIIATDGVMHKRVQGAGLGVVAAHNRKCCRPALTSQFREPYRISEEVAYMAHDTMGSNEMVSGLEP